jgi:Tol biopolymer transport system component
MRLSPAEMSAKLPMSTLRLFFAGVVLMTLAMGPVTQNASAAHPGANGKIVFVCPGNDICVMDADGTNVTQLTFTAGNNEIQPVVSPDGTMIAFTSDLAGIGFDIWVMGIDGSNPTRLTVDGGAQNPTWSPDGTQIAFETNRTHVTFTIWVMNADGSNQHLVINKYPSSNVADPAWSPDGSRIAYVRANPCPSIAAASAIDGSGEVVLVECGSVYAYYPAWSPDGGHLAYQHIDLSTGFTDIYAVDVATFVQTNLTADGGAADDHFPAWSPDGTQIAYAKVLSGQWHIFLMNANGTGKVNLASGYQPDWGPAAASPPDTTPPSVICGSPDGLWHAGDVSILCTASDSGSGLADPVDASFSLVTRVPAGAENANASTNSRQVCDNASNCSTAGPIAANKVDKKAPSISIGAPGNGAYLLNAAVASSYGCSDGGSGVASCSGPVASGSNINTSSVGSKSFTVAATDAVGNSASQTVTYDVAYGVFLLYNPVKPSKMITLQLRDANGINVSNPAIVLTAQSIDGTRPASGTFSYSKSLADYKYTVNTSGLAMGSHTLQFKAGSDQTVHSAPFTVR